MLRALALILLVASLVIACDAVSPTPTPTIPASTPAAPTARPTPAPSPSASPTLGPTATDKAGGWIFERPADWVASLPTGYDPLQGGVTYFLSNFPLRTECVVDPKKLTSPLPTATPSCLVPFASIPPGGIYIETYGSRTSSQLPTGGEPVEIMGRPSRLELDKPGRCATQVTDEVIKVPIPDGVNDYHVLVIACLMGPNVEQTERQFRDYLASIRLQP